MDDNDNSSVSVDELTDKQMLSRKYDQARKDRLQSDPVLFNHWKTKRAAYERARRTQLRSEELLLKQSTQGATSRPQDVDRLQQINQNKTQKAEKERNRQAQLLSSLSQEEIDRKKAKKAEKERARRARIKGQTTVQSQELSPKNPLIHEINSKKINRASNERERYNKLTSSQIILNE